METFNKARDIVPQFIAYASAVGLALWVFMGAYHDISNHHVHCDTKVTAEDVGGYDAVPSPACRNGWSLSRLMKLIHDNWIGALFLALVLFNPVVRTFLDRVEELAGAKFRPPGPIQTTTMNLPVSVPPAPTTEGQDGS